MDASLFPIFIENVILCCYPGLQKKTVCDPMTGHKIKGPLVIKTDNGPGRCLNNPNHIEYILNNCDGEGCPYWPWTTIWYQVHPGDGSRVYTVQASML